MHFFRSLILLITIFSIESGVALANVGTKTLRGTPSYWNVIQTFQNLYAPLVRQEMGIELDVQIDEENPDYFGGASLEGRKLIISLGNNLPQQQNLTEKAIAFALCHEVGHLVGGAPHKLVNDEKVSDHISWASAEGQSDYYAAKTCLPKLFATSTLFASNIKAAVVEAGSDFILSIYELIRFSGIPMPSVKTPDESKVSPTVLSYPSLQCRLDTVVAGAAGRPRPACWYSNLPLQK